MINVKMNLALISWLKNHIFDFDRLIYDDEVDLYTNLSCSSIPWRIGQEIKCGMNRYTHNFVGLNL
jgi:hypothetical protein